MDASAFKNLTRKAFTLRDAQQIVDGSPVAAVVTDPTSPDNPIIAANDSFCELTGYTRDEVIGRNCRFLAGPSTEPWASAEMRNAVIEKRSTLVECLNYKKDGSSFRNGVMIMPLFDADGAAIAFLGSQVDLGPGGEGMVGRRQRAEHMVAQLSSRQREVLELMADGLLNKQIAGVLELSEKTVKMHRALLFKRLGVATTAEAIRTAVEAGL